MKKNKTDQHKSPCKLTACKGFSFSHYSHHTTSQQAAHHQQHRAAAHQPAPHTTTQAPATNTTSQHTAHAQTPHPRRNTSGQPAARQAAAPTITSGTPARAACAVTKRPRTIPPTMAASPPGRWHKSNGSRYISPQNRLYPPPGGPGTVYGQLITTKTSPASPAQWAPPPGIRPHGSPQRHNATPGQL